jgi:hypothetical protein
VRYTSSVTKLGFYKRVFLTPALDIPLTQPLSPRGEGKSFLNTLSLEGEGRVRVTHTIS